MKRYSLEDKLFIMVRAMVWLFIGWVLTLVVKDEDHKIWGWLMKHLDSVDVELDEMNRNT